MDTRWPKRPLIALLVVVPVLILLNPFIRNLTASPADASNQARLASRAAHQGPYVLKQLDVFARKYWARVAGKDTGLGPRANGHDEFAQRWVASMKHALRGLGAGSFLQNFLTPGFKGLPSQRLGANHIVFVPGSAKSGKTVVLGAHYDGEPFSKGSAFDDTSGSAILLGVAQVLGRFWRHHGLPRYPVEFILFDGEEQGLVGSAAYLFDLRHHAIMPRPTMMIDEEQTGIGYPAHPFGLRSRRAMPAYATMTRQSHMLTSHFGPLIKADKAKLRRMRKRLLQARKLAFTAMRGTYRKLDLRGGSISPFQPSRRHLVRIGQNPVCCSDNAPFEALGLPTMTYSGDFHYYERNSPSWSYPYDQPQDTPKAMNCDTGGSAGPNRSLAAALDLPVVLSVLLVQDYSPARHRSSRIAVLGMPAAPGASTSFAAAGGKGKLEWSFGDGGTASGRSVSHVYAKALRFTLRIRSATARASFRVRVKMPRSQFRPPFGTTSPPRIIPWHPAQLKGIPGCR